jgi:hypothetical protein
MRTACEFRKKLRCVEDLTVKANISYQLVFSDFFSWLLNRTDIAFTVREMVIKYEIILMASIAEQLKAVFSNDSFMKGINKLCKDGKISSKTDTELSWLWETRKGIHLYKLDTTEHNKYSDFDFDRAVIAVRSFMDELNVSCNKVPYKVS